MKKISIVIFLFAFIRLSGYSQYWTEQNSGVNVELNSVSPVSHDIIWVCGNGGTVLRTSNGGANWINVSGAGIPNSVSLVNIWSIDASTALVTGYLGSDTWVWRTSNSGANWVQVFSQSGGRINGIVMKGLQPNRGLLQGNPVGGRWTLFRTTNGGINWDSSGMYLSQNGSEAGWKNSIFIGSQAIYSVDSLIWFGTNNSRIYYSSNFGTNWTPQSTAPEVNTYALEFLGIPSFTDGLAGGENLIRTSNGGMNWTPQSSTGSGNFSGFVMFGLLVDYYGYCWYTRNTSSIYRGFGGSGWSVEYTVPLGNYKHFSRARSGSYCWGVRSNGGITKCAYYLSGLNQISSEVPENFSLFQNYPNPFNPSTHIGFRIAESGLVRIIVYDALGREIQILVDQELSPGTYEVDFNGAELPSGVYYYKLESGSFVETKRMVLIK
ncbi:MAG: T9SS type A sorting domain-containing protein [Ignavibacteria bacterium]|nr:T9SS type A sorting domain-containing protein [Ignavibacteria bacterium]